MKKYIFAVVSLFLIATIFSVNSVKAEILGVVGVEVKAYSLTTNLGTNVDRTNNFTPVHKYSSTGTVKLYGSGEHTSIQVRVHKNSGTKNTVWKTFNDGDEELYDEDAEMNVAGNYTLYFKNPSFTAYKLSHSGIWRYN